MSGEAEFLYAVISDTDKVQALLGFGRVHRRVTMPALMRENVRPCYASTTSTYKQELPASSPRTKRALTWVAWSQVACSDSKTVRRPISRAYSWEDRAWLRCGARAAEFFTCFSRWATYLFCGEVEQNPRLGSRGATPRAFFDKERCSVVPGGWGVD